jgi:hypothetical protein
VEVKPRLIRVSLRPDAVDALALDFCAALARSRVRYVIVSGYVAILLGRNRLSEDIDIFTQQMSLDRFRALHLALTRRFECITPGTPRQLFADYLEAGDESTSIRYANPGTFAPNVELKFARKPHHRYSLDGRFPVSVNGTRVYIGALEMDIAYKVAMGTEKDLADARWVYDRTARIIDTREVKRLMEGLGTHAEWVA